MAEPAPAASSVDSHAPPEPERPAAPPARKSGVHGGFKFGAAVPGGSGAKNLDMAVFTGTQFWFDADLGGKINESLFIGGMLGLGIGSPGDALSNQCSSCSSLSFKIGPIVRYYFSPGKAFDPWVNASTGLSVLGISNGEPANSGDRIQGPVLTGFEIAKVGAGVDWRFSPFLAVGPYIDLALGTYLAASNVEQFSSAVHTWVSLGVRFVLQP